MSFDELNEKLIENADEGKIAAMKARDEKDFHYLDIAIKYFEDVIDLAEQQPEAVKELDFS